MERSRQIRAMIIPATAATYYPTGVGLGAWDGPTIRDAAATRSTTAGDSFFAQDGNDPLLSNRDAIIHSITVLTAGSSSTVAIQSHAGTVLIPAFETDAAKRVEFDQLWIHGGFRVVTTGTPLLLVIWEPIIDRAAAV